jgi:tungstate transport system substrate-binding protein
VTLWSGRCWVSPARARFCGPETSTYIYSNPQAKPCDQGPGPREAARKSWRSGTWELDRVRQIIRGLGTAIVLVSAAVGSAAPCRTEPSTVAVGVPSGTVEVAGALGLVFQAQSGLAVRPAAVDPKDLASVPGRVDALLIPDRLEPTVLAGFDRRPVLISDVVLIGPRGDRTRVRGMRDIKQALRWIAGDKASFLASSEALGTRSLELALWDSIGVDVRAQPRWYAEAPGDEFAVADRAALLGAYVLVERVTWAGMRDRRGLEVLVSGDPALRTRWSSVLVRPGSATAAAWHDWLVSQTGQAAIAGFRLKGVPVFMPLSSTPVPSPSFGPI